MPYDKGGSGVSRYLENVLEHLVNDHCIDLLLTQNDADIFPVKHKSLKIIVPKFSNLLSKPFFNMIWHLFILPFLINKKKYDFIFLPAGNRRVFLFYPLTTITTVHDFSQLHIKGKYDAFRMFYVLKILPFFLKRVDLICSVSKSTEKDLVECFKISKEKIFVNYNGFRASTNVSRDSALLKETYKINKKYFLYVSRIEHPGKNHINLIKAYESLTSEIKNEFDLVFVGSDWNGAEKVHEYHQKISRPENIKFVGNLSSDDLEIMYSNAYLFIYPSLYEGFGIPILEAMSYGVPVLCSNCSSMPEVGGDAAEYFDPSDFNSIKNGIENILKAKNASSRMRSAGFEQVKLFSWKNHADLIILKFREISS